MSRFTPTRWNRILAWTGASLAWGTAFVAAKVEPLRAQEDSAGTTSEVDLSSVSSMPQAPPSGLSIIRYTPTVAPPPEIKRVYVHVAVPATAKSPGKQTVSAKGSPGQPPPPPATPPPPNPPSSGS